MRFKELIITIIIALSYLVSIGLYSQSEDKKFRMEVEMQGFENKIIYFVNYYQGNNYKLDSCVLSPKGKGVFEIDASKVPGGQYLLYAKPDFQIEMLIDDGQNNLKVKVPRDVARSTIEGSLDTQGYWSYLNQLKSFEVKRDVLNAKLETVKNKSQQVKIQTEIDKLGEDIDKYTQRVIEDNKDSFLSAYLRGTTPLEIPAELKGAEVPIAEVRKYVREHYLDNLDLTDPRLQSTNYFYSLIDSYINNWVEQDWTAIPGAYSELVAKSKNNKKAFEPLLSAFLNRSLSSQVMGMENVWARLAEDYIFGKDIDMTEADIKQLETKYEQIKLNRIGMVAQDLAMRTIDGDSLNLSDIDAEYIILEFYNPTCGYCREDLTYLAKEFYPRYKDNGVRVVAFNLGDTGDVWTKFIEDCGMNEFYNCIDPEYKSEYWIKYNTTRVPTNYILNKDKKIIGKSINKSNLEKLFEIIIKDGTN
ncbi:TlpA family protein disulfide reductase [Dysgonomonas massiliensis]|uniref:TlpA family protein disulfide reductase n=1 Tax=Dysgonomonas massiliensis TaxID=2040292 RepID=UPI000C768517|nr:TlpA disulfide reductase family protein [Dysgonomonas massiliensis]